MLACFSSFSQNRQNYYVVVKPNYSLTPLQEITNPDETLSLQLADSNLESFLNSMPVYAIRKEFDIIPTSSYLQRMYRVTLDNDTHLDDFFNRDEIEYVELANDLTPLYLPDDYQDFNGNTLTQLDLINAPLAWNITKGDPNVLTGVIEHTIDVEHEDYINQIVTVMGDGTSGTHGTIVTGLVAAQTNNSIGIASIGHDTKLALLTETNGSIFLNDYHNLSLSPGVRVINISSGHCDSSPAKEELFRILWEDYGDVVVCASGNGPNGTSCDSDGHGYMYPASYDHTISVGAISHLLPIGTNDPELGESNWRDVIPNIINNPTTTSSLNDKVDIFSPGFYITATIPNNGYDIFAMNSAIHGAGTSYASPIVAGTVALMFSINPNLTPDQVRDILKTTADDISQIPENSPFLNYLSPNIGRLNAYRAVLTAQCMLNPTTGLDLLMQNSDLDNFDEPDIETQQPWRSEDIWVRNQNDGLLINEHQNPEYDPNNPNYVYVKVTNNSCETSTGTDNLKLYWAKANTALSWPEHWDGTLYEYDEVADVNVQMGNEIATLSIPPLEIGQEAIIEFEWNNMPNPLDYENINPNPWHFCLLARIDTPNDPMTFVEGESITQNVLNNNNIAWKNTTVVDIIPNNDTPLPIGGVVAVGNYFDQQKAFTLELVKESNELGKSIYEEAEVTIEMDDVLYNAWVEGGEIEQNTDSTKVASKRVVNENNAIFNNIILDPNEIGTLYLTFNFLTKELTDKTEFIYHLIQRDAITNEVIGGETFEVRKKPRDSFLADAGNDAEIDKNETITINAEQINEDAIYNWYDPDGNLIYTGTDLTVSPEITIKYKLEIISNIDGFKDYDEIEVTVNPYKLESLIPNPASQSFTVNYLTDGASSAYVMMVNMNTGSSDNYILDTQQSSTSIDISTYTAGLYNIILVCDGVVQNSKTLIKQ